MLRALSIPTKLLLPLLAFGGIALTVLPADFHAVEEAKAVTVAAPKISQSFNVAPMPVEVINKAPVMSPPRPAIASATPKASPTRWLPSSAEVASPTIDVANVAPTTPGNLSLDHVNSAVNVREEGRKGSPILFVLAARAEVRVAETTGNWTHIYSDQGEGWVFSGFVGAPKKTSAPPAAKQSTSAGKMLLVAGTVTVRDAPSGAPLFKLEDGDRIRVVDTEGNWARILTSTGDDGWVRVR